MRRIYDLLCSFKLVSIVAVILGLAFATATFVEAAYDTNSAKILIYNSRWLEFIYLILGLSMISNFIKFKIYRPSKWSVGLFHFSFILMLLGSAVTRYVGSEGVMHLREGEISSNYISTDPFFEVSYEDKVVERKLLLSPHISPNYSISINNVDFRLNRYYINSASGEKIVEVKVGSGDQEKSLSIPLIYGVEMARQELSFGDKVYHIGVGHKLEGLPFELKLIDFNMTHYGGSRTPSSYESRLTLIDRDNSIEQDERIFMNSVLDYGGYRFFQSSYDRDEQGTILSINHDQLGTDITYLGYLLMILGIIFSLIRKGTYLKLKLKSISKLSLLLIAILSSTVASAKEAKLPVVDPILGDQFGSILVQGVDGRVEPISTYSGEILRKIYGDDSFEGLSSARAIISILSFPKVWKDVPLIKLNNSELAKLLKLDPDLDHCAYNDLLFSNQTYKLYESVRKAYQKSGATRTKLDREIIKLDERFNVFNQLLEGDSFALFPDQDGESEKWLAPVDITIVDRDSVKQMFMHYSLSLIRENIADGKPENAQKYLQAIDNIQQKFGGDSLPKEWQVKLEVLYNKVSIFKRIFPLYMMFGVALFLLFIYSALKGKSLNRRLILISVSLLFVLFLLHSVGLVCRGLISGHMPWSNGYESMIYVAWAGVLAAFLLAPRDLVVLSSASLLAGAFLMVAHLSWINPEVTNLMPVLKSYWLTFHVSTITASYGFFGLAAIAGLFNLIIICCLNLKNREELNLVIDKLTSFNEVALIVGLYLLMIGTFLGAIWANESWGRYWGWDPKETWSLITIIIYSGVTHLRFIPKLKSRFTLNFISCISFSSVLMTYLGVNYYLAGLHSYGATEAGSMPWILLFVFVVVGVVALFAKRRESKFGLKGSL